MQLPAKANDTSFTNLIAKGEFHLTEDDDRYSLYAHEAPVEEIVLRLVDQNPSTFRYNELPSTSITTNIATATLEGLLQQLKINYMLTYRKTDDDLTLDGAWLPDSGESTLMFKYQVTLQKLLLNLVHDQTKHNAEDTLEFLYTLDEDAVPVLESYLTHWDYQARQCAALALTHIQDTYADPPAALYDVMVEGLQNDAFPNGGQAEPPVFTHIVNARSFYLYFLKHPEHLRNARTDLLQAVRGSDMQQQFLSAILLAELGPSPRNAELFNVLLPHLKDNQLSSDASLATHALAKLGQNILPMLRPHRMSEDKQLEQLVRALMDHLNGTTPARNHPVLNLLNRSINNPITKRSPLNMVDWQPHNFEALLQSP